MLCNKGCEDCIETNFRTGFSDSFLAVVDLMSTFTGTRGFQSIPVNGTCVSFGTNGDWDDGNGGTAVAIDYKFEGMLLQRVKDHVTHIKHALPPLKFKVKACEPLSKYALHQLRARLVHGASNVCNQKKSLLSHESSEQILCDVWVYLHHRVHSLF